MMNGKVILITGATNGIGKLAATELARQGAQIVIAGRNPSKCKDVVKKIQESTGNQNVEWMLADLSSMKEVRALANEFKSKHKRLDVLINNAGAMFNTRIETVDGYEQTFALNHLNYFLLTQELLDVLKATAEKEGEARIVNVSSGAHIIGRSRALLADPQMKEGYSGWQRYSESKLANIMFTYELARRLEGTQVTINALHPGFVNTGFAHNNGGFLKWITNLGQNLFAISQERGAETSIYLASSPEVKGISGKYFYKKKVTRTTGDSRNEEAQKRLWNLSEELVKQG